MSQAHSNSRRAFVWQGILILLPILILAGVGVYAIRQDRAGVEQEARERAEEIARDVATRLSRMLAAELSRFELVGNVWAGDGIIGGSIHWPGRSPITVDDQTRFTNTMSEWHEDYPQFKPEDVLPIQGRLEEGGGLGKSNVSASPPMPAAWVADLSEEQQTLWTEANRQFSGGPDCDAMHAALRRFFETKPPLAAQANAGYIELLCRLQTVALEERVKQLLRFASAHRGDLSESGLPLSALALSRAFAESSEMGLTEELFEAASPRFTAASYLTPRLFTEMERLASKQPIEVQDTLRKARLRWQSQQRLDTLTRHVQQILSPTNIIITNLWFEREGRRWFTIFDLGESYSMRSVDGQLARAATNQFTKIRFFPEMAVIRAAELALEKLSLAIPPYLGVRLSLKDRLILDQKATKALDILTILARSSTILSQPGFVVRRYPFETLPSQPPLLVEVTLSNPSLLYSQAQRRAWVFGSLIVLAALVAVLGLAKMAGALAHQQRLSELKTNFVSSVSHELRAPLASVRLMAEGLESGRVRDEPKQHEYFKFIVQECRRLTALVENVLDFSRIEQGRKQYNFELTDIVALVEQTVKLMEPYAAERNVKLTTALALDQLSTLNHQLRADGRALQQALVNLIDNAIKHSSKDATVTAGLDWSGRTGVAPVSASQESKSGLRTTDSVKKFETAATAVLLWVEDHGSGIPPEEHERIFERFYRRGSELHRETQGVGIGLSIVKHIVEAHGGRVLIESTVGKGSRFTIELPLKG